MDKNKYNVANHVNQEWETFYPGLGRKKILTTSGLLEENIKVHIYLYLFISIDWSEQKLFEQRFGLWMCVTCSDVRVSISLEMILCSNETLLLIFVV